MIGFLLSTNLDGSEKFLLLIIGKFRYSNVLGQRIIIKLCHDIFYRRIATHVNERQNILEACSKRGFKMLKIILITLSMVIARKMQNLIDLNLKIKLI